MELQKFLNDNNIPFTESVLLSRFTGMNLKGTIPIVAKPTSTVSLIALYGFLLSSNYSYEIVGCLTNTYLCESFYRDIIIQTTHICEYTDKGDTVEVSCGYNLTKLAKKLSSEGIAGYEGFIGIPGTVGAAVINNSGAFNSCMENVVKEISYIDLKGQNIRLNHEDLQFGIRETILKSKNFGVLLTVVLDTSRKESVSLIGDRIQKITTTRKKEIDGKRKSLGSIIVGPTQQKIWDNHRIAFLLRKILYLPFKYTPWHKRANCILSFLVLGKPNLSRHCDNLGRFCWTNDTKESDFFEYLTFLKEVSIDNIKFEIEIKK